MDVSGRPSIKNDLETEDKMYESQNNSPYSPKSPLERKRFTTPQSGGKRYSTPQSKDKKSHTPQQKLISSESIEELLASTPESGQESPYSYKFTGHRSPTEHQYSSQSSPELFSQPPCSSGNKKIQKNHDSSLDSTNELYPDISENLNLDDDELEKMFKKINSPKSNRKSEKTEEIASEGNALKYIFIILAVLVSIYLGYKLSNVKSNVKAQFQHEELLNHENVSLYLMEELKQLETEFTHQNEWTWKRMKSALRSVSSFNPNRPAVVTVLSPLHSHQTTKCIIEKLKTRIHYVFSDNKISKRDITFTAETFDSETMVTHLKKSADRSLEKSNVWVLDGFEYLSFESASLIMSYTDHEFAPYKRAVIFIILHLTHDDIPVFENSKSLDYFLEHSISKSLKNKLKEDKINAVISRISGRGILIEKEEHPC